MPSQAALAAFKDLKSKAEEIPTDERDKVLLAAEKRVNEMTERGKIYDEKAESKVVKFDQEGMSTDIDMSVDIGICIDIYMYKHRYWHIHQAFFL